MDDIFSADNLSAWLDALAMRHPQQIELGLERVDEVRSAMDLVLQVPILTVGGTNGKGSVCAFAEAMLLAGGVRVGCYTSPHLLHFGERVRVDGVNADEQTLIESFAKVENARAQCGVSLTYFEFTTLAAAQIFADSHLDVVIMEVGLGGRLDAVNIFTPTVAVVTNIALDHQDFLGETIDEIAIEKAGIFRQNTPAIIADANPPTILTQKAESVGASIYLAGRDFASVRADDEKAIAKIARQFNDDNDIKDDEQVQNEKLNSTAVAHSQIHSPMQTQAMQSASVGWHYYGKRRLYHLPMPSMRGRHQVSNAAAAICAIENLPRGLWGGAGAARQAMHGAQVVGRAQVLAGQPVTILDVAHNAAAAVALERMLFEMGYFARTVAVFGMKGDKDVQAFAQILNRRFDCWYVAQPTDGDMDAATLAAAICDVDGEVVVCDSIADASAKARASCGDNDRIVVTGSFLTVADYLQYAI